MTLYMIYIKFILCYRDTDMPVSLAYVSVSGITRDTDISAFMGLSPNKDLKKGLIRAESVFLALYMIYIMLYIMPGTLTPPE